MSFDRKKAVYLLRAGRNLGEKHSYDHWPDWKGFDPVRACIHYGVTIDIEDYYQDSTRCKDNMIRENCRSFDYLSRVIGNNVIIIEPVSENNPETAKIAFVGKTTSKRKLADPPMNFGEYGEDKKKGEHSNYVEVDGHELKNKTLWMPYFAFRKPKNMFFTCTEYTWTEINNENNWDKLDSLYDL